MNEIIQGDWIEVLKTLPDEFVQCVITSPPYWGLRDYGTATWEGGLKNCDHKIDPGKPRKQTSNKGTIEIQYKDICPKCGAKRIDQQLGLEKTPEEFIEKIVTGFREIRRVLRKDGTVWLNLGDSYATDQGNNKKSFRRDRAEIIPSKRIPRGSGRWGGGNMPASGNLKPKDLCMMPHRVALALQADGWWVRSDIVWAKPNPMPESVTDRPTKSHEYIFLLTKSPKYYYDADAVREKTGREASWDEYPKNRGGWNKENTNNLKKGATKVGEQFTHPLGRNLRSVWTIATQACSFAHFATFPEELVNKCILAGTSETACGICGAPYKREVELPDWYKKLDGHKMPSGNLEGGVNVGFGGKRDSVTKPVKTLGFWPTCEHDYFPIMDATDKCVVLDPFGGTNTVGFRAQNMGRNWITIELNPKYEKYGNSRTAQQNIF